MELNTTYFKKLHEIGKVLETGRSMIDEQYIDSFNLELKQVEDGWQDVVDTNRTLKIGIVGGVKAGKSSFLNALLFRGRDILPKAATPMTAALTKIPTVRHLTQRLFFMKIRIGMPFSKMRQRLMRDLKLQ